MKNTSPIGDPERRSFLTWLATSAALVMSAMVARPAPATERPAPGGTAALKKSLGRIIRDRRAAAAIGRLYLAAHPEERTPDRLAGDLMGSGLEENTKALYAKIQELRVRDFSREDTVIVGGWVLARIEARVCALMLVL